MEIIELTTKKDTFGQLIGGEVREYAREIRPKTMSKYCELDEDGYVREVDGILQPRKYDAVRFKCGESSVTFSIAKAQIELFEDEDHELITYEENGEEYIASQIVYFLGTIIETVMAVKK